MNKLTLKKRNWLDVAPMQAVLLLGLATVSSSGWSHGDDHKDLEDAWYMNIDESGKENEAAQPSMPGTMAPAQMDHGSMDHGTMNHGAMDHGAMDHGAMDHGAMDHSSMNHDSMTQEAMTPMQMAPVPMGQSSMDHSTMDHDSMGHGSGMPMQQGMVMDHDMSSMQGGSAPADARDPHSWSDGYTLTSGPYAMEGPRQLVMGDEHWFSSLQIDKLGIRREQGDNSKVIEGEYWIGSTWDRLALTFDGSRFDGENDLSLGAYWRHALTPFWNTQLGVKRDQSADLKRNWVGAGFEGLAPYWFESEAMLYVSKQAVTLLELKASYDILFSQRWIMTLEASADMAGKNDPEGEFGRGLGTLALTPELRYEVSRQFAPYLAVERSQHFGKTRDLLGSPAATAWQAGVRVWF